MKDQQVIGLQEDLAALSLQRALQMGLVLPKPKRSKSGADFARQVIPADVRNEYERLYGKRWEERWRAEPGTRPAEAKRQYADWLSEINCRIETIRSSRRGEGIELSQQDAFALAGEWYTWFVARYEHASGQPELWDRAFWQLIEALEEHAPDDVRGRPQTDLRWTHDPDVRSGIRPVLADLGHTAQFLTNRGIALSHEGMTRFLDCVLSNYLEAVLLLGRQAEGDFSADELPQQFPKFRGQKRHSGTTVQSPWELFDGWVQAKRPANATVNRWRAVFKALDRKFKGAAVLTEDEAQAWARELVTPKRSPATVRDVWVNAARVVYQWAKGERLVETNPFVGVNVSVPRKTRNRENDAFRPEEAQTILRAASEVVSTHNAFAAAKRWVPWLCAYSGARAGEITQLRGGDIEQRGTFYVMRLTPDAGTIKTGQARVVPLHEHIIEQGFLQFVHAQGKGPLFYNVDNRQQEKASEEPLNPRRPRAVKTRERLAQWVRDLGITDEELQPNHAWRDTFKQIAERHGISERVHDAITGHAPKSVGRTYGRATPEDMAQALQKFPRYDT